MPHVLLAEDESSIADNVTYALTTEGFQVTWAKMGNEALDLLKTQNFDFLILDIGLPDLSGFDVLRQAQKMNRCPPVLILTARSEEIDRVLGLELGADDYVVKPFSPRELSARVRAILRRTKSSSTNSESVGNNDNSTLEVSVHPSLMRPYNSSLFKPETKSAPLEIGPFRVNPEKREICYMSKVLALTAQEYHLLNAFISNPGRVYSREQIMNIAWEEPLSATPRTVDAHIKTIRAKLRDINSQAEPLKTSRGHGYVLDLES